jgi:hypothetical protein
MITGRQHDPERVRLALLACIHVVMCVVSLISVAYYRYPLSFDPYTFHIFFDTTRLPFAIMTVAAFGLLVSLFVFTRFSFGYFVAFYCYTMVLGYIWLNNFTDLVYDHRLAAFSAAASAIAFMLPALLISAPIRQVFVLSERGFDRLLLAILLISVAIVLAGASYNFRLVGVEHIYEFRDKLKLPILLSYLTGIVGSALLPFVFAGFLARRAFPWALASLFLILCLYPITLSKLNLLAPLWLVGFFILSRIVEARIAVMLSLLLPITAILVLATLFGEKAALLVSIVNFRMIAIPSVAIDVYSDFFSRQPLTHFCQVSFLKPLMDCPYQEVLSLVMEQEYKIGNFNASLFATEGIASVGLYWAPVVVLACGFIIAIGNRVSASLPPSFVMISGAVLPQVILNVPLSTVLLTHGAGLLFLLWYITPRSIFSGQPQPA